MDINSYYIDVLHELDENTRNEILEEFIKCADRGMNILKAINSVFYGETLMSYYDVMDKLSIPERMRQYQTKEEFIQSLKLIKTNMQKMHLTISNEQPNIE